MSAIPFEYYRAQADSIEARRTTTHPLPRVGVFVEELYEKVVSDPRTIFDENGMPIVASYKLAYPHANIDGYPELSDAAYSMLPLTALTSQVVDEANSSFGILIGELTSTGHITPKASRTDYENAVKELALTSASSLEKIGQQAGRTIRPLRETGLPLFHIAFFAEDHDPRESTNNPKNMLNSQKDKDDLLALTEQIARQHSEGFRDHSLNTTVIKMTHSEEEIQAMIEDPSWLVQIHRDQDGVIDGSVFASYEVNEFPWLDPVALDVSNYGFVGVESITTTGHARGTGVAANMLRNGLTIMGKTIEEQTGKKDVIVTFDTAGEALHSIPLLSRLVVERGGYSIGKTVIDSISHIVIEG